MYYLFLLSLYFVLNIKNKNVTGKYHCSLSALLVNANYNQQSPIRSSVVDCNHLFLIYTVI